MRAAAATHFDCPDAAGAPLEDEGGLATAGSHWETSLFQTELMIGSSTGNARSVLSNFTLGVAQDSGWYLPNFGAAGFLRYGHLGGCDMLVRLPSLVTLPCCGTATSAAATCSCASPLL